MIEIQDEDGARRGDEAAHQRCPSDGPDDVDRRLNELLQELRVLLPGATVLFAFLLQVPMSNRFHDLGPYDRALYFVAFVATALALMFLLAEAGYHRLRGHPYDKQVMVRTVSRQAVAALVLLGVALIAAVALVADLVYGANVAVAATIGVAALVVVVWFGLPLVRRARGDRPVR